MAYQIVLNKKFLNSLTELLEYLETEWGVKAADDFLNNVDARINTLQNHPFIGASTKYKNVRGLYITKHNRMYYRVTKNKVTILNLYDTRRKNYS